jgi:hypothetical protein
MMLWSHQYRTRISLFEYVCIIAFLANSAQFHIHMGFSLCTKKFTEDIEMCKM